MKTNKAIALTLAAVMSVSAPIQQNTAEAAGKDTSKLSVTKKNITLTVGASKTLVANKTVTWKCSDKKVAKVTKLTKKKAKITAKGKGKCTITVKSGNKQVKVKVTVKPKTQQTAKPAGTATVAPETTSKPTGTATVAPETTSKPTEPATVPPETSSKPVKPEPPYILEEPETIKPSTTFIPTETEIPQPEITPIETYPVAPSAAPVTETPSGSVSLSVAGKDAEMKNITVTIWNGTENQIMFGREFSLEKLENGDWKKVKFKENVAFTCEGIMLNPGQHMGLSVALDACFERLEKGKYRISKQIYLQNGNENIFAEFTLASEIVSEPTTSPAPMPPIVPPLPVTAPAVTSQPGLPVTPNTPATANPSLRPITTPATANPLLRPITTPTTAKPSVMPNATPSPRPNTARHTAMIYKIENNRIFFKNGSGNLATLSQEHFYLQLTNDAKIVKMVNGVEKEITMDELFPNDKITIISSGLIVPTYPDGFLADCEKVIVESSQKID